LSFRCTGYTPTSIDLLDRLAPLRASRYAGARVYLSPSGQRNIGTFGPFQPRSNKCIIAPLRPLGNWPAKRAVLRASFASVFWPTSRLTAMGVLQWIGSTWCELMHPAPRWPINGFHECPSCLRKTRVAWGYHSNQSNTASEAGYVRTIAWKGRSSSEWRLSAHTIWSCFPAKLKEYHHTSPRS